MSELIPRISSKIHDFLNLLFAVDAECILCGEEAHTDNFGMCKNCASMLIYPNDTEDLLNKNQYLDGICVAFAYSGTVPDGVLRMKYGHRLYLSEKFAAHPVIQMNTLFPRLFPVRHPRDGGGNGRRNTARPAIFPAKKFLHKGSAPFSAG